MLFLVRVRKEVNVKLRLQQQYLFLLCNMEVNCVEVFGSGLNPSLPPLQKRQNLNSAFACHLCRYVHVLSHDVICSGHPADGIQFKLAHWNCRQKWQTVTSHPRNMRKMILNRLHFIPMCLRRRRNWTITRTRFFNNIL